MFEQTKRDFAIFSYKWQHDPFVLVNGSKFSYSYYSYSYFSQHIKRKKLTSFGFLCVCSSSLILLINDIRFSPRSFFKGKKYEDCLNDS